MQVTIVVDKPSTSRALAPFARKEFPGANITFVHLNPFSGNLLRYPRGRKWADYPVISEPVSRVHPYENWIGPALTLLPDGGHKVLEASHDALVNADCIIAAMDLRATAAVCFEVLMQQTFKDDRASTCRILMLKGFDNASIVDAFAGQHIFGEEAAPYLKYGRMKRYFDWNWNTNGLAILGETQRLAGVPQDAPPLSKLALQLLYGLRHKRMSEYDLYTMMTNWKGTGRYASLPGSRKVALGSASSRTSIMSNLVAAGLLHQSKEGGSSWLALSDTANRLLGLLHPDCEDADLPFRVNAWCEQGEAAKPAVDRYIKTFFGKQKRFLDSRTRA